MLGEIPMIFAEIIAGIPHSITVTTYLLLSVLGTHQIRLIFLISHSFSSIIMRNRGIEVRASSISSMILVLLFVPEERVKKEHLATLVVTTVILSKKNLVLIPSGIYMTIISEIFLQIFQLGSNLKFLQELLLRFLQK